MAKRPEYGDITRNLLTGNVDATASKNIGPEPRELITKQKPWTKRGLKPGETRTTFIIDEAVLNDFRLLAYWERSAIKDLLHDVMLDAINAYVKKNGPLKPRKPRRR